MRNQVAVCIFTICHLSSVICHAQFYTRTDTIPVKENGTWLKMPWVGGHNYCQFSDIDMNFDGTKDLFVFDRTGNKITTCINKGTPNMTDYFDSTSKYAPKFPHLEDWALLRDYNCDGKPDIFTYSSGGIKVWKNNSSSGNLQFVLQASNLKSNYCPSVLNLSITGVDIPTIDDIDGDGDLDILTFGAGGINMQYHVNKSKELGYGCDSLLFNMDCGGCWGNYETSLSGCNVTLGSCRMMNPDSSGRQENTENHLGNCSLCIDMDGDGDKDMLLGQLGCCNMTMLTNGGKASSADMTSMDDSFPSYNIPAMLTTFPCGYFLDLNNDNKRDLVVSPNSQNISLDNQSIWYYLNIGTDNVPVFSRQTRSFLQKDMIDVGEGADPVFFDFNSDGLTDLLISNYRMTIDSCPGSNLYGVLAFKNIGTSSFPKFDLVNSDYANLSSQLATTSGKHLTFGDIDGDGDADMCAGDYGGFVHYFQNTAGPGNPAGFNYIGLLTNISTSLPIDVGSYSTPQLIDVDRDGDLDLLIGEGSGNLNYYENMGTSALHSFSFISGTFGGVDVLKSNITGFSVPFMYDSSGSYRLFVGSEANRTNANKMGWLWKYNNIDGNLSGNFTLEDSTYQDIWEGLRMTVHGNDINNDGALDLVIGNYAGGVAIYLGDSSGVSVSELNKPQFNFTIHPNPSTGEINISLFNIHHTDRFVLNIYNSVGQQVLCTSKEFKDQSFSLDASFLPGGIYSCELKLGDKPNSPRFSKKLILLK